MVGLVDGRTNGPKGEWEIELKETALVHSQTRACMHLQRGSNAEFANPVDTSLIAFLQPAPHYRCLHTKKEKCISGKASRMRILWVLREGQGREGERNWEKGKHRG